MTDKIERIVHDGSDSGPYNPHSFMQFMLSSKVNGVLVLHNFVFPNTQNVYHCYGLTVKQEVVLEERCSKITAFGTDKNYQIFEKKFREYEKASK
jgi:hypothetical protein